MMIRYIQRLMFVKDRRWPTASPISHCGTGWTSGSKLHMGLHMGLYYQGENALDKIMKNKIMIKHYIQIVNNGGIFDLHSALGIMPGFIWSKYPTEKHMIYIFPAKSYSYLGPGSQVDIRLDDNDQPRPRIFGF